MYFFSGAAWCAKVTPASRVMSRKSSPGSAARTSEARAGDGRSDDREAARHGRRPALSVLQRAIERQLLVRLRLFAELPVGVRQLVVRARVIRLQADGLDELPGGVSGLALRQQDLAEQIPRVVRVGMRRQHRLQQRRRLAALALQIEHRREHLPGPVALRMPLQLGAKRLLGIGELPLLEVDRPERRVCVDDGRIELDRVLQQPRRRLEVALLGLGLAEDHVERRRIAVRGHEVGEDALGLGCVAAPDERHPVGVLQRAVGGALRVVLQQGCRLVVGLDVQPRQREHAPQGRVARIRGQRARQRTGRRLIPLRVERRDAERGLHAGKIRRLIGSHRQHRRGVLELALLRGHHTEVEIGARDDRRQGAAVNRGDTRDTGGIGGSRRSGGGHLIGQRPERTLPGQPRTRGVPGRGLEARHHPPGIGQRLAVASFGLSKLTFLQTLLRAAHRGGYRLQRRRGRLRRRSRRPPHQKRQGRGGDAATPWVTREEHSRDSSPSQNVILKPNCACLGSRVPCACPNDPDGVNAVIEVAVDGSPVL